MNCKYCNSELVEGKPFCPSCGKVQTDEEVAVTVTEEATAVEETMESIAQENSSEEKPLPFETAYEQPAETEIKEGIKATPGKIALAVVAGIVVLAILIALIVNGLGGTAGAADPTIAPTSGVLEATEEVVPVTIPSDGNPESNLCKESYTVTAEEAADARDVVVATMGDKELTNGELQAYYWMEVSLFLQEYGSYAEYIGLDLYTPFDQQVTEMGETPMSWQQYFMDCAIYSWKTYQSMELEAEAADYVLPEERQTELEELPASLEQTATDAGMASVDELVAENIGPGAKLEDYLKYVETYYNGMSY